MNDPLSHRRGCITIDAPAGSQVRVIQQQHHFTFGTALAHAPFAADAPADIHDGYLAILSSRFNAAVHENALKWLSLAKQTPQADFSEADHILSCCQEHGIAMRGHCLLWEKERFVPAWLKALDDAACKRAVQEHIEEVVGRYAGRIDEFDVNNEMIEGWYFQERFGLDFIADCFRWAQAANPQARLFVNDYHILNGVLCDRYVEQIKQLLALGAPVTGIGCQGHFFEQEWGAQHVYDDTGHLQQYVPASQPEAPLINDCLDKIAAFDLPILITEYDSNNGDPEAVAENLRISFDTCFKHPSVAGIYQWGFWKGAHWSPNAALYDDDFSPLPAGRMYEQLVFKDWWTDETLTVGDAGRLAVDAWLGRHEVTIDGQVQMVEIRPDVPEVSVCLGVE